MDVSPKLIVEVVADVSQFVKSMSTSSKAATGFQADLKAVSVDARAAANAQVAAAVKTTESLQREVAAYHEIAAAAERGSKEQIAAARLGATAQSRLDASLVGAAGSARKAHGESGKLGRELEHVTRGAISGTGAVHGFGRSLAFASGGFVAFEGVSRFFTESINAAREASVAQRSLAAQMQTSGESFDANRERIDKVALSYGKFGFQNDAVIASLTVLERGTGNINKAISLQGLTANLARAKNLDLAKAATVVAKVFGGQETALRRAVPGLQKSAHGWELIRQAQAKLAGQAVANTTASERFAAVLHDTEEIVGRALLPTLNQYLTSLSKWLDRMNRSGELQRDVAKASQALSEAVGILKDALHALNFVTGSTKTTLKLLFEAFLAFKAVKLVSSFADMATNIGLIGRNAKTATGEVAALNTEMGKRPPGGIGVGEGFLWITAAITAAESLKNELEATKSAEERLKKAGGGQQIFGKSFEGHAAGSRPFVATQGVFKGQMVAVRSIDGQTWVLPIGALKAMMDKAGQVKPSPDVGFRAADLSAPKPFKATAAQRNTWFDAIIGRQISRVSALPLEQQLAEWNKISAAITKRIAITKDITRKLNLSDQLFAVEQSKKAVREQQQQAFFDRLQLNVDMTSLTKTVNDDLAALAVQQAGIEKQIQIQGHTLALDQAWLANQQAIAAKNEERAAAQKAAAVAAQAAAQAARDEQLAWADVGVAQAAATPGLQDNLRAAKARLKLVTEQAAIGKQTAEKALAVLAAQADVNAVVQQIAANRRAAAEQAAQDAQAAAEAARTAAATRQFRALGFGPGGAELIPGAEALRKRLATVGDVVKGSFLDTAKTRGLFAHIKQVLSGGLGAVGEEVRSKVASILDDIDQQLKDHAGDATRFQHVSAQKFVDRLGLSLTPAERRRLQAGISQLGPAGALPQPSRQFGLAGAGGMTFHGDIHVHGVQDVKQFENQLAKRAKSRAQVRRGAN